MLLGMGTTNLQLGLERKLSHLKGELEATHTLIARTEAQVAALPEMRAKIAELRPLIEHATALMQHLNPEWETENARAIQPFVKQIPTKLGSCSRKAMEILRNATEPMSARELANEVLRREGFTETTQEVRQRMANTVQAALRARRGTVVDCDGHWPQRWWAVSSGVGVESN